MNGFGPATSTSTLVTITNHHWSYAIQCWWCECKRTCYPIQNQLPHHLYDQTWISAVYVDCAMKLGVYFHPHAKDPVGWLLWHSCQVDVWDFHNIRSSFRWWRAWTRGNQILKDSKTKEGYACVNSGGCRRRWGAPPSLGIFALIEWQY